VSKIAALKRTPRQEMISIAISVREPKSKSNKVSNIKESLNLLNNCLMLLRVVKLN